MLANVQYLLKGHPFCKHLQSMIYSLGFFSLFLASSADSQKLAWLCLVMPVSCEETLMSRLADGEAKGGDTRERKIGGRIKKSM